MKKITKLIFASSLLIASSFSVADNGSGGDAYNSGGGSYNNSDWGDTPWGRNNSSRNRNSNNMPWSPMGSDNPFWDSGSDFWRDWDTNKWGGNGMPWGNGNSGNSMPWGGGNSMPWSKKRKYDKNRGNRGYYGRPPYGGGYGNPYPYQGNPYGGNPYNAGQGYAPVQ